MSQTIPNTHVLQVENLSHWFGDNHVLFSINLKIRSGQIVALVGPSGCGKSTLLRAVLGTHPANAGHVLMDDKPVTSPGRDRGIVYQRYSLFPFMTACENVAFGLMLDQTSPHQRFFFLPKWRRLRTEHLSQAKALLERLGLAHAINKYPAELSGGMRQRVAIAQALIMKPQILLLDEPFGALDEATREDLQQMVLELYAENQRMISNGDKPLHTILMVTHELNEALYVSDRVLGLSQYWDWRAQGHTSCPGATIIYDQPAPIYEPNAPKNFSELAHQRETIRSIVFEPKTLPKLNEHIADHVEQPA
jgi:NitT/TauT family transport system ATP-binding protein